MFPAPLAAEKRAQRYKGSEINAANEEEVPLFAGWRARASFFLLSVEAQCPVPPSLLANDRRPRLCL